jgi:3-hydroxybutyrate dehydrogenase
MTNTYNSLGGRVALITGGGSGIGKAIAKVFAESGATVIINDIRDVGQEAADQIGGHFLKADLSDMQATRDLAESAIGIEGRVDILVNNAGYQNIYPVEEFPDDIWAEMVQVMLIAPFQLIKYVVPGMKEQNWGRIINISSIHGLVASPYKSAYNSAKHGIVGLTKTVALELGEFGVTANAICPGYVRTPLVESQVADQARTRGIPVEDVVEKVMLEPAAIKRLIDPEEVAGLAAFLASDTARSITGSTYSIDAGWVAR